MTISMSDSRVSSHLSAVEDCRSAATRFRTGDPRTGYRLRVRTLTASDVLRLTQPHPHDGGHPGLLHGHAIDRIGRLHGPGIVGDDQELGVGLELVEQPGEPADVGVIQRGVHLVHQAERAGLGEIDAEEERHRHQRALAGREQVDALGALAPGRRVDVDLALERVVRIGQSELALAAAEQGLEHRREVGLHRGEGLEEHGPGGPVDLPDGLDQRLARAHQVVPLGREKLEPLELFGVLLDRQRVHRPDRLQRVDDPRRLGLQRLEGQSQPPDDCAHTGFSKRHDCRNAVCLQLIMCDLIVRREIDARAIGYPRRSRRRRRRWVSALPGRRSRAFSKHPRPS